MLILNKYWSESWINIIRKQERRESRIELSFTLLQDNTIRSIRWSIVEMGIITYIVYTYMYVYYISCDVIKFLLFWNINSNDILYNFLITHHNIRTRAHIHKHTISRISFRAY